MSAAGGEPVESFNYPSRLARLREILSASGLQALLVSDQHNIRYLSGFRGSSGALLITAEEQILFSDFRYRLQAAEQALIFHFQEVKRDPLPSIGEYVREKGLKTAGFEAHALTVEQLSSLRRASRGVGWRRAKQVVETLRQVKHSQEIAEIARAAKITDDTLEHILSSLAPGRTEHEIALEGTIFMMKHGAKASAFDVIVASGPRAALPHAESSNRTLERGDLVILDLGARLPSGYCSDLTRTVAVGRAQDWQRELYSLVYEAQAKALDGLRAGVRARKIDAAARGHITAAGHGGEFGHGLGHGVGLDVHEAPRLAEAEKTMLRAGMVVTVEPGVYLSERGGVRIEDLVVIGQGGCKILSHAPKPAELPVL
ncbi:MAG: M24 family metallopeptidase [Armatimonadetes bacterium]|nr:M24 family metallopeptidase [Armatimonadota bacterium]NIM24158.1 M24 family metallopeptidase [Armatimonadota bacterium]NIM68017.1 M24 family metallopeptidase [Armatimonadota bacterium]NIM76512.1 M24 family metallopeptidase [Armatimonadota bacterium]NIN06251.1 M24 family metallopeptidase [Armatimonadota bacterium]